MTDSLVVLHVAHSVEATGGKQHTPHRIIRLGFICLRGLFVFDAYFKIGMIWT